MADSGLNLMCWYWPVSCMKVKVFNGTKLKVTEKLIKKFFWRKEMWKKFMPRIIQKRFGTQRTQATRPYWVAQNDFIDENENEH